MSLRIALLGTLAFHGPASGYELAKRFDASMNLVWQAKHSQIYPELSKLVQTGAATVEAAGDGRGRKIYTVTEEGRNEIVQWVTNDDMHRRIRSETALRGFLVTLLPPDEAADVMRAEAEYHANRLAELEVHQAAVAAKTAPDDTPLFGTYALDLGLRITRVLSQWAAGTAEDLERRRTT
ncbi:helix-turn-helix transcriptional regulator [Streptomyces sp. NPDC047981]|uniref:helix-turn-helix transcriptional regulator n=1 Tax=Streptomyces sp. NPDC047981 TaxID=3154610 RepID=UPI003448C252